MEKLLCVMFLVLCVGITWCEPIKFKECGSPSGHIHSVDVTPCGGARCLLPAGHDASFQVNFTSNVATQRVKAVVHGYVIGIPLPFPLPQSNGCKSGVQCPVKPGDTNIYVNTLPVRKAYPRIKVTVKMELKDEKGKNLACFTVPVKIK